MIGLSGSANFSLDYSVADRKVATIHFSSNAFHLPMTQLGPNSVTSRTLRLPNACCCWYPAANASGRSAGSRRIA